MHLCSCVIVVYTGGGLAHAQDLSNKISCSLSPQSSPAQDPYWNVLTTSSVSPPSVPFTDTMEEPQTAEIAVMGELTSEVNMGTNEEVMDLATAIQNQLSADDEIEVQVPQDATSSNVSVSKPMLIAPSKQTNLPLKVKDKIVPGMIFSVVLKKLCIYSGLFCTFCKYYYTCKP